MLDNCKVKAFIKLLYIVYLLCLFYFVTCKFQDTIRNLSGKREMEIIAEIKYNRSVGYWNYNLKPFEAYHDWITYGVWDALIRNLLGNIVAFMPMGFFEMALSKSRKLWKITLKCLVIVLCLEIFQFVSCLGYLDIDDITMNTFGCFLGGACFIFLRNLYHKIES